MEKEKEECSICLDYVFIDQQERILKCNHMYHEKCIYAWSIKENSCPICRVFFDFDTNNQKDFLIWMDIKLENFHQKYRTKEEQLKQLVDIVNTTLRLDKKNIKCSQIIYETMLNKLREYKFEFEFTLNSWICWILTLGFFKPKNEWYEKSIKELQILSESILVVPLV